jgi:catechol 2,3-dioxygenase-like lactoylglutathione lyase family enzyme
MMTVSLVGATLHVADVDRSLAFYRQLPGVAVLFHMPGRFAMLKVGTGRLGLLADQKRQFHLEIETPDLDAVAAALRDLGIEADGPTTRAWGERDILVLDPDGYLIEFGAPRAGS